MSDKFDNETENYVDIDTASSWAVRDGDVQRLERLIEAGADVNAKNDDGDTLCMQAVKLINSAMSDAADIELENFESRSNHENHDPYFNPQTSEEYIHDSWDFHNRCAVLQALIDAGADVNIPNNNGETPRSVNRVHEIDDILQAPAPEGAKKTKEEIEENLRRRRDNHRHASSLLKQMQPDDEKMTSTNIGSNEAEETKCDRPVRRNHSRTPRRER